MATAAEGRTFLNFQMPPISRLQQLEVGLVVAIKAVIVAMMSPVGHNDVLVLFWDDHVALVIELELQRFVFFMTSVAIQSGDISTAAYEVRRGHPRRCGADEVGIDQRNCR